MSLIKGLATLSSPILNLSVIRRIRRNHGLEHATIHILSKRVRNLSMAGRSDMGGFYLYGEADTEVVTEAVHEALRRMQHGEYHLAVHPNCGTMLVTSSFMTSIAAIIGLTGARNNTSDTFNRFPVVLILSVVALILSQPLGLAFQKHFTTYGEPGDLEIVDITCKKGNMLGKTITIHRVNTRRG